MNPPGPEQPVTDVPGLPARIGDAVVALAAPAPRRKVLLFRAAGEWFALPLERVREVCPRAGVTRVPRAPAPVLGVMNLRGRVVTVVDLARCLGLPAEGEAGPHLVLLDLGDPDLSVGLPADRIDQVADLDPGAPGGSGRPEGAGGADGAELLEVGGHVATLLDPVRVLAPVLLGVPGEGSGTGDGPAPGGRARA